MLIIRLREAHSAVAIQQGVDLQALDCFAFGLQWRAGMIAHCRRQR
jgi:hypothetical protein